MAESRPLKLTDMGSGTGRLEEFANGDTLPVSTIPDLPIGKISGLQAAILAAGTTMPALLTATPISASSAVAGFEAAKLNSAPVRVLSQSNAGGWLTALGTTAPYIDIALPFGVVIGDSIAEGHPSTHGRLHPDGSAGYIDNYASTPGQPSYELSRLTGSHWYNQGIGSQTSADVLGRFDRDALGLVSDPGDGRGNKTLPGKPYICLVIVGANDVAGNVSEAALKENLQAMLAKLLSAGVMPVFSTVAPSSSYTASQRAAAQRINAWMLTTFAGFGAVVFDLYSWGSDGAAGIKSDRYIDTIHPSRAGYAQLALDIYSSIRRGICSSTLRLDFKADPVTPPTNWVLPAKVRIAREGVTLEGVVSGDWIVFSLATLPALQSPVVRVSLVAPGTGNSGITGAQVGLSAARPAASGASGAAGVAVAATLSKTSEGVWEFNPAFAQRGVYSVSAGPSGLTITCEQVSMIMCGNVGSAAVANKIKVSASWGLQPVTSFTLQFGNGDVALDPTTTAVPNGTYYSLVGPSV